jgi:DNA-binding PadR family transcriptional regulator
LGDLSPTSFALLALLSIRSWSAYELTRYMRESTLRAIWPRAESHIYSEVKRLEGARLASSEVARQGGRKRAVYSITPLGRDALREWIVAPSKRLSYESEAMVKVAYAEHGGIDDLRGKIAEIRDEALSDLGVMRMAFESIVTEHVALLPDRRAYNALVSRFILEMIEARLRWVEYAEEYVAGWEDTGTDPGREGDGDDSYTQSLERVRELLRAWRGE